MFFPIKIIGDRIPAWLQRIVPNQANPHPLIDPNIPIREFERRVSAFKVANTWKTTKSFRHPNADRYIIEKLLSNTDFVILDVGSSTGVTSLNLIEQINGSFKKYFITDRSFYIKYTKSKGRTYYYDPKTESCVMVSSNFFLFYNDFMDAFAPFRWFAKYTISKAPPLECGNSHTLELIHPHLKTLSRSNQNIIIQEYDILQNWIHEPVNIIKAANVLNLEYFSKQEIEIAVLNLSKALAQNGTLIIVDNRKKESYSCFIKHESKLLLNNQFNGGVEIESIITSLSFTDI